MALDLEHVTLNDLWSSTAPSKNGVVNLSRPRILSTTDSDMVAILDQVAPALNSSLDSPASHDVRQFALQLASNHDDVAVPTFPSPFPSKTPSYPCLPDAGFTFPITNSPVTFSWPAIPPFDEAGTINLDRTTNPSRCPSPMPSESSERSYGSSSDPHDLGSSSDQHELRDRLANHHTPARGRKRKQQLESMTEEERVLEAEIRAERNRQSARDCRVRKKSYIRTLQAQVELHKGQLAVQADAMAQLKKENERVTAQLNRLRKLVEERARKERLGRSA